MSSSLFINLFFIINSFHLLVSSNDICSNTSLINSRNSISQEYIPLHSLILRTFVITNPGDTNKSILIRNKTFYKVDGEQHRWERLCISRHIYDKKVFIF